MRRGQTGTLTFHSNIPLNAYSTVILTIEDTHPVASMQNKVHITATSVSDNDASFDLEQEDTLALRPGTIKLQLRAKAENGHAITSNILTTLLQNALKEDVI